MSKFWGMPPVDARAQRVPPRPRVGAVARLVAVVVAIVWASIGGAAVARADEGRFRFSSASVDVGEGQGFVRVVVERADLPVSRTTVAYRTVPGSAVEGEDFDAADGILTFDVGATSASFVVVLRNDRTSEPTEQLTAVLGERSAAMAPSSVVRILDDDDDDAAGTASRPGAETGGGRPTTGAAGSTRPGPGPAPAAAVVAPGGSGSGSSAGGAVRAAAPTAAGSATVAAARPRVVAGRARAVRPSTPRRVTVRQRPVTPFELRPTLPTEAFDPGPPLAIDPVLAVAAALLLARVAAEVWFRLRTGGA